VNVLIQYSSNYFYFVNVSIVSDFSVGLILQKTRKTNATFVSKILDIFYHPKIIQICTTNVHIYFIVCEKHIYIHVEQFVISFIYSKKYCNRRKLYEN